MNEKGTHPGASPFFVKKKNCRNQLIPTVTFGGDEGSRTPVRRHFLKDLSGRSHFIEIPAAVRQMTGLQGW